MCIPISTIYMYFKNIYVSKYIIMPPLGRPHIVYMKQEEINYNTFCYLSVSKLSF